VRRTLPISPYVRLRDIARRFASAVVYPERKVMWTYTKAQLGGAFRIDDLYHRTAAANTLGFDVVLTATDDGLRVDYRKRAPDAPSEFWN
jgi:hypothetical protein